MIRLAALRSNTVTKMQVLFNSSTSFCCDFQFICVKKVYKFVIVSDARSLGGPFFCHESPLLYHILSANHFLIRHQATRKTSSQPGGLCEYLWVNILYHASVNFKLLSPS